MKSPKDTLCTLWNQAIIGQHMAEFTLSTANECIGFLAAELELNNGFSPTREARIRELQKTVDRLVSRIDELKSPEPHPPDQWCHVCNRPINRCTCIPPALFPETASITLAAPDDGDAA